MPLWVVPNKKVSVQDVENVMRDHYEGTPLSVADGSDIGGGIWEMPYRPTPLMYKVDGKQYFNERPVSTQQSGFVFVSQMRFMVAKRDWRRVLVCQRRCQHGCVHSCILLNDPAS